MLGPPRCGSCSCRCQASVAERHPADAEPRADRSAECARRSFAMAAEEGTPPSSAAAVLRTELQKPESEPEPEPEPEREPEPELDSRACAYRTDSADSAKPIKRSSSASALKPAREARTVWVGAVPEALAKDEPRLADVFQQFGDVETITARVKDTATHGPGKSWAFVGFVDVACAKVRLHAPAPPRLRLASTCAPAPPASAGAARHAVVNPGGCACSDVSSRERWWSTVAR